jgi:MFS family permease
MGAKAGLVSSMGLYCSYVVAFTVTAALQTYQSTAVGNPQTVWAIAIFGSFIGGLGAGWLWTAQGKFFSQHATLYARQNGCSETEARNLLAGLFSFLYLLGEVLMKGGMSFFMEYLTVSWWGIPNLDVFTLLAGVALGSTLLAQGLVDEAFSVSSIPTRNRRSSQEALRLRKQSIERSSVPLSKPGYSSPSFEDTSDRCVCYGASLNVLSTVIYTCRHCCVAVELRNALHFVKFSAGSL